MPRKIDYSSLFTLRKDGRYQTSKTINGKVQTLYDRDPKRLYDKLQALDAPKVLTFADCADKWEEKARENISERTWHNYAPHVKNLKDEYGTTPAAEITAETVTSAIQRYKAQGYSRTIVNTVKVIFRQTLDQAVAEGAVPYNVAATVQLPKGLPRGKRRAPTDEEIITILTHPEAPFASFAILCLCTGLRKGEALALLKSDVDMKKGEISVTKALTWIDGIRPSVKTPKTDNGVRTVPIIDVLRPVLNKLLAQETQELFTQSPSTRNPTASGYMSERAYDVAWAKYCKDVGFIDDKGKPTVTAHMLRHGTATLLYDNDVDVHTAQRVLGHANLVTTLSIYTDLRERRQRQSLDSFNKGVVSMVVSKSEKVDN